MKFQNLADIKPYVLTVLFAVPSKITPYYIALKLPHKTREEEEKFAVGKRCKFLHKNTIKEGKITTQY